MDKRTYLSELQKIFTIGVATCDSVEDGFIKLEFNKEECGFLVDAIDGYLKHAPFKEKWTFRFEKFEEGGNFNKYSPYGVKQLRACDGRSLIVSSCEKRTKFDDCMIPICRSYCDVEVVD